MPDIYSMMKSFDKVYGAAAKVSEEIGKLAPQDARGNSAGESLTQRILNAAKQCKEDSSDLKTAVTVVIEKASESERNELLRLKVSAFNIIRVFVQKKDPSLEQLHACMERTERKGTVIWVKTGISIADAGPNESSANGLKRNTSTESLAVLASGKKRISD